MLKFFGRNDIVRDEELFNGIGNSAQKYRKLEYYNGEDYKTAYNIERPIRNIEDNQFQILSFLESYLKFELTDDGVFSGSFGSEFNFSSKDLIKIQTATIPTPSYKYFVRLKPGIAGVTYTDTYDQHKTGKIVVNRPSVYIAQRQLEKILKLNALVFQEFVEIKYNYSTDTYKCKIRKAIDAASPLNDYFYTNGTEYNNDSQPGYASGIELIQAIYNDSTFTTYFDQSIGRNFDRITLEPVVEVATNSKFYWYVDSASGEFKLSIGEPESGLVLNSFRVVDLENKTITEINNTHIVYGDHKRFDIHGVTDNSFEVNTAGGIHFDIAKGLYFEFNSGASLNINQNGNIIINTPSGQDIDITSGNNFDLNAQQDIRLKSINGGIFIDSNNGVVEMTITPSGDISFVTKTGQIFSITSISGVNITTNLLTLNGSLTVTGNLVLGDSATNTLTVNSDTTFNDDVNIKGNTIVGDSATNTLIVNSDTTFNDDVNIKGNTIVGDSATDTLTVNSDTTFNDDVNVKGNVVLGDSVGDLTEVKSTLQANENATFQKNVVIKGTLEVDGGMSTIKSTEITLADNIIALNNDFTGTPPTTLKGGLEIKRGSGAKYNILYDEQTATTRVGFDGNEQRVATMDDDTIAIPANTVFKWDATNKKFVRTNVEIDSNNQVLASGFMMNSPEAASDTGFKSKSDGVISILINNVEIGTIDNNGITLSQTGAARRVNYATNADQWSSQRTITINGINSTTVDASSANGTFTINIAGIKVNNAGNADTVTDKGDLYNSGRDFEVSKYFRWKNYGNGYVIFDASASTSPTGSAVNYADSEIPWSQTYPVLMGWNGVNTYGVRVDSARKSDISIQVLDKVRGVTIQDADPDGTTSTAVSFNGYVKANRFYGAVWNDFADFIEVEADTIIEFGKAYILKNGKHQTSSRYADKNIVGITSDTFGISVGQKEGKRQIPIAVSGFALCYVDKVYETGVPLVATKNGNLTKANLFIRLFHSERIIATFYKEEKEEKFNGIVVNNRKWVKVR